MKLIFSFIAAFVMLFQQSDLETIREAYSASHLSKQNSDKLAKAVENSSSSDFIFKGYKAASEIVAAKFMKGPERKNAISSGIKSLESNIKANPSSTELRLIRLSVQENLPKIVGYHKNMGEDKDYILKNYGQQNAALKKYIRNFAAGSKTMTAQEKNSLR